MNVLNVNETPSVCIKAATSYGPLVVKKLLF